MNEQFLPTTREGKLERLVEECAEVIQAVQKLKRFGPGPNMVDGKEFPDNIDHLLDEMKDLEHALAQVRCIDLAKLAHADAGCYTCMRGRACLTHPTKE